MNELIYADNAATTKLDREAYEAMIPFLLEEYGNASQQYTFSKKCRNAIKEARNVIAECINAKPEEIFFTSGGTESDNWAIKGFGGANRNCNVITSVIEHHAILNTCKSVQRAGGQVIYVGVDSKGLVLIPDFQKALSDSKGKVALVSIMLANNEIGTIEPIKDLVRFSHEHGAVFHTDAVQAVGHIEIDVNELQVDMLSASAHKFNGPKGVGFLFIRNGIPIVSHNDGGAQEHGLRAGTENVPAIVGMAVALKNNCEKMNENARYVNSLEERLLSKLYESKLPFIRNGADDRLPGSINVSFKDSDGEMLLHRLDLMGICISTGSACDSKNTQVSHVIKAIEVPKDYANGTIRISLGPNNTQEDVDRIVSSLCRVLKSE